MRKREKNKIFPAKDFQQISPQRNIKSDTVKTEKKEQMKEQMKEQTKEQIKERGEEEASRS
jgi:hypothetical protein